ncbi:MAG TPA: hypothetical protein VGO90_00795 [Chthoniobacteraceae bacterium]|jgi:hypothetical protein|nr:hypothetical protein [Chthoniobacter sp.]HEV7866187.1 hypothetical protein [Chthoniobacteraceae bacterium]
MKVPLELLAIVLLLLIGWKQSYRDHLVHLFSGSSPAETASPAPAAPVEPPGARQRSMLDL